MLEPTAANQVINCAKETSDFINHSAKGSHTPPPLHVCYLHNVQVNSYCQFGALLPLFYDLYIYLFELIGKVDLWPRCKKSLNHRFGRTNFSSYDFVTEFSIYRKRNLYPFVNKTVLLI